jgi:(E)-4-hydroxy-3-methyl-but-2-enyl pyrophosphate reductase
MKVQVAAKCGFCPGVRSAISTAEDILSGQAHQGCVFSLGPVIHNQDEVIRLEKAGLKVVQSIDEIDQGTVLIRSHGAAPDQLDQLERKEVKTVDATCVLVKRLQKIAKHLEDSGYQVIIIGDQDHPEVQAVVGGLQQALVIANVQDIDRIPHGAKLGIVSQTTQDPAHFGLMLGTIGQGNFRELRVINTLCKESRKRQEAAVQLCQQVDIMFVLGGLHSANTKRLAEMCQKHNKHTYHLQGWQDLDPNTLIKKQTAGVTAGASTPDWIIDEFVRNLEAVEGE